MRNKILLLFVGLGLLSSAFLFSGCAGDVGTDGPYHGDSVLYNADFVITRSYSVLHDFVSWEYQNRPLLVSNPGITEAADNVRKNSQTWIGSAIALRETYAVSPTADNKKSLLAAIAILQTALNEATKYMVMPTAPPAATTATK